MAQIVVVEGFAAIRVLFQEIFMEAGHTIFAEAGSLEEAQAVVARCVSKGVVPIFVIGDLTYPNQGGELAASISSNIPYAPIVSCSEHSCSWSSRHVEKGPGMYKNLLLAVSSLSSGQT